MNIWIPWRTWSGRAASTGVSSEKYPISRVCPKCGSGGYKLIGQSMTVPFGRDRECVNCATRYAPRQSKAAGVVFILLGLAILIPFGMAAGNNLLALFHLHPDKSYQPTWSSALCPAVIALAGAWMLDHGIQAFRRIRHAHGHGHAKKSGKP